jgi:hypothetical protein
VSVTSPAQTKVYGANDPALGGIGMTLAGLVNNPAVVTWNGTVAVNDSAVTGTAASLTRAAGENVGSYNITNGSATLSASGGNYTQSFSAANSPKLTITTAPLAVSLTNPNQTKVYGANDPTLGGTGIAMTLTGLVNRTVTDWNGTVVVNDSAITGTAANLTRVAGENVGSYAVTNGRANLSGSASNYTQSFSTANSPVLTITPKALTITANDASRLVGVANPPFTATYSGFVSGSNNVSTWNGTVSVNDTPASLTGTLAFATPATPASPAGAYSITPSGQTSTNYTITYVNGTLTVIGGTGSATLFSNETMLSAMASTYSGEDQLAPRGMSGPTTGWTQSQPLPSALPGVQPNASTAGAGSMIVADGGSATSAAAAAASQVEPTKPGSEPVINGGVRDFVTVVNGGVRLASAQAGALRWVGRR